MSKILWTKIDEAPALATYSLLPVVSAFLKQANIDVETIDISLAGRIIATFPQNLSQDQQIPNNLELLGKLVKQPQANIIKLPNISASVSQLKEAIAELQAQGFDIPSYPEEPKNEQEEQIKQKYSTCLGSAVNPVLREGNSDRRAAAAVKNFAKNNPHKLRAFDENSKSNVSHMSNGDFYENEKSIIKNGDGKVSIKLNGEVLKEIEAVDKEILDATFMSKNSLRDFYQKTIDEAKQEGTLWSLHLKATMMKVSDPIMFGHAVEVFFKEVFEKYATDLKEIGCNSNLGLADLYKKLEKLPEDKKDQIQRELINIYTIRPSIAMVNSDNGITNLHASNDVIIDASMPVVIRDGGQMWNWGGHLQETKAVIPDRCYATMYKECLEDCKRNGQFNVSTMGNVSNVGLMAQKAEEYGSHPTTFEVPNSGTLEVVDSDGTVLMSHEVEAGDIWRMSRAKDIPIKDWVRLAVERARLTSNPAVFWLDENRAHDANVISKVKEYLKDYDTSGLEIEILDPQSAMAYTLKRVRAGQDTISVTGNVLRDYLTDLFPILELGTSAKMLSIVPLLAGGGLFETGAGGSAPKHVEQFLKEGHLRWDSLGEFLALAESLRFIEQKNPNDELKIITSALDEANSAYLDNNKAPSRKAGEPDNKASHYFLATYWANALANQKDNEQIAQKFASISKELKKNEDKIIQEFLSIEGKAQDIGGYFHPDRQKAQSAMRPSSTFNSIIAAIN